MVSPYLLNNYVSKYLNIFHPNIRLLQVIVIKICDSDFSTFSHFFVVVSFVVFFMWKPAWMFLHYINDNREERTRQRISVLYNKTISFFVDP